jgi:hypothetical protein
MKHLRLNKWLFFLPLLALQVTWYVALMSAYVSTPGELEGADFLTYYAVGRVALQSGLDKVYDLSLAALAQAQTAGLSPGMQQVLPPNHPPFLYPILALLAYLPYRVAYFGYAALLYGLAATSLPVLVRTLKAMAWNLPALVLVSLSILLFEPFFISVLKGQDTAVLLLGGLLGLSGFLSEDDRLSGLGLSLTLIRPQIALGLALPFLFRRRKVLGWFVLGAVFLGLYSFLQAGWQGAIDYWHILTLSAQGEGYGMGETAMFNLLGLLRRLVPTLNPPLARLIGWGGYAATLVLLSVVWKVSRRLKSWHLALAVSLTLFAVPHLHYHDLALLLVPVLSTGVTGVRRTKGRWSDLQAAALPMMVSVLLLFSDLWDPARFTVPYLLMAIFPFLTWHYETR